MHPRLGAIALGLVCLAAPARGEVDLGQGFSLSGMVLGVTDYVYRGISQTRGRPALQGLMEVSHESGFYIGAFASNVAYPDTNARQELDISGGYRFDLSGLHIDLGATAYTYPGYTAQPEQFRLNYGEAILRLGYDFGPVTLQGTAAVQPPGWSPYGTSYFLGGRAIWRTPLWGIVLVGDLGYQWIQNNERYGTPDYLSYAILAARDLGHGFALVAGWSGTNIPRTQCAGGAKTCDGRFVAGIAWRF